MDTEQQHPGKNDQWGHNGHSSTSFITKENASWNKGCILSYTFRFLVFFPCFLQLTCYTQTFLAPKLQDALGAAFALNFQRNSPLIFWQLTGIICSSTSLQCLPLPPTVCLVIAPLAFHEICVCDQMSGFKISSVMVTTVEYLCV